MHGREPFRGNKWSGFNPPGQLKQVCIRTKARQNVAAGYSIIYPPKYALLLLRSPAAHRRYRRAQHGRFQHVAAIRQLQRLVGVLLDEEIVIPCSRSCSMVSKICWMIMAQDRAMAHQATTNADCSSAPTNRQHLLFTAGHGACPLNTRS